MEEKDFEEPNYDELSDGSGDVKKNNNNNNNNNQKKTGDGGDGLAQTSKVFVASLSDATTTASLRAYCEGFGFPLQVRQGINPFMRSVCLSVCVWS